MGQHKHNPKAQAAKRGELPPKKRPMGKREWEAMVTAEIYKRTGMDRIYSHIEQVRRGFGV